MSFWRQLTRGFRALANRDATDRDVADEVEHYLEEATATLVESGLSPRDARRAALLEVGNRTLVREQVRSYGWENTIESCVADLRYGARRLARNPGFTLLGALTIALGVAAARRFSARSTRSSSSRSRTHTQTAL